MSSFTLDTNCVIAVSEGRPEAEAIKKLAAAHAAGEADVAIVAIMASEHPPSSERTEDFNTFLARLEKLGLGHLGLCYPLCYLDVCFWDACFMGGPEDEVLENQIHDVLFPNLPFSFEQACAGANDGGRAMRKWLNAKCDVLALWSHINADRSVFVTADRNFLKIRKCAALLELGAGAIEPPHVAAARF